MNKYFLLFLLIILSSCGKQESYQSEYYNNKDTQTDCKEPENPYSEGGHYEGYNWAQEKGQACSGNSDSFIEGCEEYYSQIRDYEECKK